MQKWSYTFYFHKSCLVKRNYFLLKIHTFYQLQTFMHVSKNCRYFIKYAKWRLSLSQLLTIQTSITPIYLFKQFWSDFRQNACFVKIPNSDKLLIVWAFSLNLTNQRLTFYIFFSESQYPLFQYVVLSQRQIFATTNLSRRGPVPLISKYRQRLIMLIKNSPAHLYYTHFLQAHYVEIP